MVLGPRGGHRDRPSLSPIPPVQPLVRPSLAGRLGGRTRDPVGEGVAECMSQTLPIPCVLSSLPAVR